MIHNLTDTGTILSPIPASAERLRPRTVAFVPCLPPGLHAGTDAIAHGLRHALAAHGISLRIHSADLRSPGVSRQQDRAVREAIAFGAAAVVVLTLDMREPSAAVRDALALNVPVVAIHKPAFPTSAAVVVPNFLQGVFLVHELMRHIAPGRGVAVAGGPDTLGEVELLHGIVQGVNSCGLRLLNDPFDSRYRNLDDVAGEGRAAVEALLQDHPYPDAIIIYSDETMHDALAVLRQKRMLRRFPLVCRNGSPAMVAAVQRGEASGTFDCGLPEIGLKAGELVLRCLAGERDIDEVATVGRMITRRNASDYVPWEQRVPHAGLAEVVG